MANQKLQQLSKLLHQGISETQRSHDLSKIVVCLSKGLNDLGIPIDRLQLPMSSLFGLRHPFYLGFIITWTRHSGANIWIRERSSSVIQDTSIAMKKSPYAPLIFDQAKEVHISPSIDSSNEIMIQLAQEGYTDYFAMRIPFPDGAFQVMSIATQSPQGFNDEMLEALRTAQYIIALSLYVTYQSFMARQVATTYLGKYTGLRVLDGDFYRGSSEQISAFILFADIRNFTALSEKVGALKVTEYINQAFEILYQRLDPLGGEILKFIGDAALIIFPDKSSEFVSSPKDQFEENQEIQIFGINDSIKFSQQNSEEIASPPQIISALTEALTEIQKVEITDTDTQLDLGVGLHVGEVIYGNIGAKARLDFTVMGPAVNLASRIEGLTKQLGCSILISEAIAQRLSESERDQLGFQFQAPQYVKGVTEQINLWGIPQK